MLNKNLNSIQNRQIYSFNLSLFIILTLSIFLQVLLLNVTHSIMPVIAFNGFILLSIYFLTKVRYFPTILLLLSIIPMVYIETGFSRYFVNIVLQNIPLYILFLLALFHFIRNEKLFSINIPKIFLPIIIYIIYCCFLFFVGIINNGKISVAVDEIYQNFYFLLAIPIAYLIINRNDYLIIFEWILVVFLFISLQYIIVNLISPFRYTTYHNHFFPFVIGAYFSKILFEKKSNFGLKLYYIIAFVILILGSIATATRTLLIANLVTISIITYYYFSQKFSTKVIFSITATMLLLVFFALSLAGDKSASNLSNPKTTEERIQNISNPLGDISFLMRVETAYLGFKEFVKNPVIGIGFGHKLQLKWLLQTAYIYPDNNYIYYLWKGGIIFFLIAMWMFYLLVKNSLYIYNYSTNNMIKIYSLSIFAGFIAFMLFAILNANLVKLKLNLFYAFFYAFIYHEKVRLNKSVDKNIY